MSQFCSVERFAVAVMVSRATVPFVGDLVTGESQRTQWVWCAVEPWDSAWALSHRPLRTAATRTGNDTDVDTAALAGFCVGWSTRRCCGWLPLVRRGCSWPLPGHRSLAGCRAGR